MKQPLHILHIEDLQEDCDLVKRLLQKDGLVCDITRVETRAQVFDELQNHSFDLILTDCKLPGFSGLQALEIAHALKPETPFIFVSGTIGDETAIESLRNGATDYVLKDRLARLAPAVRRALAETEERTLSRKLRQRLNETRRLDAVSSLSNGIAHDFNNVLTIILGHASLLDAEAHNPGRVREIAATISEAGLRASDVVQQLLAFAHKSDGHHVPTDLNRRVREIMGHLKGNLPNQIDIVFQPADHLPHIMADASQLERILINLVTNSVDSMPKGGNITLSTRLVHARDVPDLLPGPADDQYLCLKVADTGVGIDSLVRDHIFEPFYTTKERGRGTGLGLPVVHGLMQAHNGWIDVQSEPGHGTVISLFFPVPKLPPESVLATSVVDTDASLSGTETILIVEDEPDVSFFLETILQSHGYHALVANDYEHAMELFETHRNEIDLVLSDIGLPKVDGITLCWKLKELEPSLKVILCSGYASKDFQERIDDLGAEFYLSKPYTTVNILESVRSVLDDKVPSQS
ncbi:MAG: response regulator [Methylacidiphilales bacterium]|nr:response regulator [Candidatus Methylacidiphilales bacterium]